MRPPLSSICVVGGGQVALLAAAALARALPTARVELVRTPRDPGAMADAAHGAFPALARLHKRIGIDEDALIAGAAGTHRLATAYKGWRRDGRTTIAGYPSADAEGDFASAWIGAGSDRDASAGPGAALASAGRFARPATGPPLTGFGYAMRFSPAAHEAMLLRLCARLQVTVRDGAPADADLIVDAGGMAPEGKRVDWSRFVPVDRVLIDQGPPRLSPLDGMEALADGVRIHSPSRDATRTITCAAGGKGVAVASWRLEEAWRGNVVAIGDGAASLPPLGGAILQLAAAQIELLLAHIPAREIEPLERREYNRRAAMLADNARDFVAAHFAPASCPPGIFWEEAAKAERPASLTHRIEDYVRRGRVPFHEEDIAGRAMWKALLGALGYRGAASPRAAAMAPDRAAAMREAQRRRDAAAVAAALPYPEWIMRHR